MAGTARLDRARPDRPGRPGGGGPRQPRPDRRRARPAAAADRGRQPRRRRQPADRVLPVDVHGRRPRPDPDLPVPDRAAGLCRRGAAARGRACRRSFGGFLRGQALMGVDLRPDRAGATSLILGLAARGRSPRWRRGSSRIDPVLRAVRFVGAAGHRRPRPAARVDAPGDHPDGRRLVRRHERPPAAAHAAARSASTRSSSSARSSSAGQDRRASPARSSAIPIAAVCSALFFIPPSDVGATGRSPARAARRVEEREGRAGQDPARADPPAAPPDIAEPDDDRAATGVRPTP